MARWTPERRRKARVTAGFAIYYGIFLLFIYGPMIAMFILFCLRGTRVLTALLIAIGFSLLISVAFTYLLSVPLPKGPLGI